MDEAFFATCPRGLEDSLAQELSELGVRSAEPAQGGAHFAGGWEACYRANVASRLATRVLWRVGGGAYRGEEDLYRLARGLAWPMWFDARDTIRVATTAVRSPLKSLDFVTLRIKDAVCDRFRAERGSRPSVDTRNPAVRIHAFLTRDEATLYLDTSGEALYKRGFRSAATEAPLRENLAAGLLRLSGWDPSSEPLLDPMCGGGTLLIEAALAALGIAPGLGRSFGFERLRIFDSKLWKRVREDAERRRRPVRELPIFGADRDARQVESARRNLRAAGLEPAVNLRRADILELAPPARFGVMVANPPYGVRMEETEALARFYPRLGDALKSRFSGWRCYLFSADRELARLIGLRASRRIPLFNGGLECRLYEYRMVAGKLERGGSS